MAENRSEYRYQFFEEFICSTCKGTFYRRIESKRIPKTMGSRRRQKRGQHTYVDWSQVPPIENPVIVRSSDGPILPERIREIPDGVAHHPMDVETENSNGL